MLHFQVGSQILQIDLHYLQQLTLKQYALSTNHEQGCQGEPTAGTCHLP